MSERHEIQTRRSRTLDQSPHGTVTRRRNRHSADASAPDLRSLHEDATPTTAQTRRSPYADAAPSGAPRSPYADAAPSGPARSPYTDELSLADIASSDVRGLDIARSDSAGSDATLRRRRDRRGKGPQVDDSGEVVELDLSQSSRSQARQQRADVRRAQRLRNRVAVGVAVAAIGTVGGTVGMMTGVLPFSDHITTVSDDHNPSPTPTGESSSHSPLPEVSPTGTPTSTASPSGSPTASPTTSGSPSPSGATPGTNTARPSTSTKGRGTVALRGSAVGGWYAGGSGIGIPDGKFQDWLGQPVTVAATWADTSDEVQRTLSGLSDYRDWKGALDIAVGGTVLGSGESYSSAANGAYDDRWRAAARVLAETRRNATGPTFVRPFHEMNGDWYSNWVVTKDNSADYKKAFARMAGIFRQEMPSVYIVFSPNFGDTTGLPISYWYPGDSVVDVVGVDYYDDGNTDARVSVSAWNTESDDRDNNGNPFGPESWRQFAKQHGKPLSFPEYGLKPEGAGTDHPEWIKAFNAWMNKNANTATWRLGEDIPSAAAGKVIYSCYFNVVHEGSEGFTIYGTGANPQSAEIFPKLKWGNRAG